MRRLHRWARMKPSIATLGLVLVAGCHNAPAERAERAQPETAAAAPEPAQDKPWIPAEHQNKWKEAAVFIDGVQVGVLAWEELPRSLRRDEPTPRVTLAEYLKALGHVPRRVREVHAYADAAHATRFGAAELKSLALTFSSREADAPPALGALERVAAIAVYAKKRAPKVHDDGTVWEGTQQLTGTIPYFGPPRRGGVRVYLDGKLAAWIKRNRLPDEALVEGSAEAGQPRWDLFAFLEDAHVRVGKVLGGEALLNGKAGAPLDRGDLTQAQFEMGPRKSGAIVLLAHGQRIEASTLHLYTRPATQLAAVR